MPLIEFLLSNWFIVVLIYVVISALAKKLRGGSGDAQSGRPRQGMPPFSGDGPGWPGTPLGRAGHTERRVVRQSESAPQTLSEEAPQTLRAERPEPAFSAPAAAVPRSGGRPQDLRASFPESLPEVPSAPAPPALRVTQEDVARGVMWAEILGPPRARKPYRGGGGR